ncbi:alpha/beta fold hydrolase [Flavobacterium reichenbachii]|uniref:Methyltransferase n=1 Tax=Flavobacterium reichenbachii TaxID=362418 RepID=A0A085ZKY5_9FLAO|nr:alpha/beta fold hydrolase [Flavobacterium reichenbachii]KFF05099.1 methyltransferase [Flavobacterium reichenbachii]OXB16231.1 methyltransferase [Flavobacterium reichenbachii]
MKTQTFISFDQAEIYYKEWDFKPSQKTLIVLHRGHEHSDRMTEFATDPRFAAYNIFSFDLRGHGHTKEPVSPVFMDYVRDMNEFVGFLNRQYEIKTEDIFVVANSITGVIVSAWVHDFAPQIAGMALLAPAFDIKLYVPFAKEFIALGTRFNKDLSVKSYVKAKVLTHDKTQQDLYNSDPLITKSIHGGMLVNYLDSSKRIVEDAAAINIPTIVFSAGTDYVARNSTQKKFFIRLESAHKEFIELKDFYHGILFEKDRTIVYDHIKRFVEESFNLPLPQASLNSDKFSKDEYYNISLKMISLPERLNFAFQKWSMSKIGFVSNGMRIGQVYGFDSGLSLDYVYKNTPAGKFGFGKLMDHSYLNAIGWRGIRIRKQHLLAQIESQIAKLQQENRPIKILDIAGGTGNYLFDIKNKYPEAEIVINDFKKSNIEEGEKVIAEKGFQKIRFTNYNCFDSETYKKLDFTPNITIISGIFELFEDNKLVSNAIVGVTSISEPDSAVIYTGQPWHPQLKMIAYVLNSHQEKDWVMRRRSQKELDAVFKFNNVNKENMLIDDFGIFTVSTGRINK